MRDLLLGLIAANICRKACKNLQERACSLPDWRCPDIVSYDVYLIVSIFRHIGIDDVTVPMSSHINQRVTILDGVEYIIITLLDRVKLITILILSQIDWVRKTVLFGIGKIIIPIL